MPDTYKALVGLTLADKTRLEPGDTTDKPLPQWVVDQGLAVKVQAPTPAPTPQPVALAPVTPPEPTPEPAAEPAHEEAQP